MCLGLSRYALATGVALALLAGCGGSQPLIGAPGMLPQSRAITTHADRSGSWMLPEAKSGALVYATECGGVCVVSYPGGQLVGKISTGGYGICSDKNGNVFVTDDTVVKEYAHGGTTPIATLSLPGDLPGGCAVDPLSGNLAVTFAGDDVNIAIFPKAQGSPTLYASPIGLYSCGYDNAGNLYVDGYDGQQPGFAELPNASSQFVKLSISDSIGEPGTVQWDGKYITYEGRTPGQLSVSRLTISGSDATIVGTTRFKKEKVAYFSWLYNGKVIAPYFNRGGRANLIGVWQYPKGGKVRATFRNLGQHREIDIQSVTVSVAPH